MKLSDIDVREFSRRLYDQGDRVEARRKKFEGEGKLSAASNSGSIGATLMLWGFARALQDLVDDHEKVPPVNGRALNLDDTDS